MTARDRIPAILQGLNLVFSSELTADGERFWVVPFQPAPPLLVGTDEVTVTVLRFIRHGQMDAGILQELAIINGRHGLARVGVVTGSVVVAAEIPAHNLDGDALSMALSAVLGTTDDLPVALRV